MLIYAGVLKQGLSRAEIGALGTVLLAARKLNSEVLKHKRICVSCSEQSTGRMAQTWLVQGCSDISRGSNLCSLLPSLVDQLRPVPEDYRTAASVPGINQQRRLLFLDTSFLLCLTRARKRIDPLQEGPRSAR